MSRNPFSHKGDNGTVAVIGGSKTMHGAPLFSALAAEASGVDLIFLALPTCHAEIARAYALNIQVHPFGGDTLAKSDREPILELLATMDTAVIGPGIAHDESTLRVLRDIIAEAPCTLVLDASALQPWTLSAARGKTAVLTPHLGELERMGLNTTEIGMAAAEHQLIIHSKGPVDRIADSTGTVHEIAGGNAGLTVGGTGDALAGLIAGLIAQGQSPLDACRSAATVIKRAAVTLFPEYGYAFGTRRVIEQIPHLLRTLDMSAHA